eukprot:TRINITY_DN24943_c0_g1_i1.p1 TRINITY_DN24943_c0_g1~~TRINITY_DN24943_c0_g1_i1.p1  ORF type:complete len:1086 (+),score=373.00 TRINITY_DN24943_c0_g1_i1:87-3344(+)
MADAAAKVAAAAAQMSSGQTQAAEALVAEAATYPALELFASLTRLLRASQCPFEMYFAVDLLKKTACRDWEALGDNDRTCLLAFPVSCLQELRAVLPQNARDALFHLYAVVAKLGWGSVLGAGGGAAAAYGHSITAPVLAELDADVAIGAALGTHVVTEFHSTEAGRLGMTWEAQEAIRQSFQAHALPVLFGLFRGEGKAPLGAFIGVRDVRVRMPVLRYVAEALLVWDFGKRACDDGDDDGGAALDAGAEWAGTLVNEAALRALLEMHAAGSAEERHLIQEAVIQLCGVKGKVFGDEASRLRWVELVLRALFELASRAVQNYSADAGALLHSACRGFRRVSECTSERLWYALPSSAEIFGRLRDLTCALCREIGSRPGDKWLREGLDLLLNIWSCQLINMLDDMMYYSGGAQLGTDAQKHYLKECCVAIFTEYRNSQLAAPPPKAGAEADSDDEDDVGGHEREYTDSLHFLAALMGRHAGEQGLPAVTDALQQLLQQMQAAPQTMDDAFFDRLISAVALGCAVCADPPQGEIPAIPSVLMDDARCLEDQPPAQREALNPVLKFAKTLFTVADMLLDLAARCPTGVSPLAVTEVFAGLGRWCKSYIAPDADNNIELTAVFTDAFEGGKWAAQTLVWLATRALSVYPGEEGVVEAVTDALTALACKRPVQAWLSSLPAWSQLAAAEAAENSALDALPLRMRSRLVEVLCLGSGKDAFQCLLPSIANSITVALNALRAEKGQDGRQAHQLLIALHRVRGVGSSSTYAQERQDIVFNWVQGLLPVLVELSETLRERRDIVATLFELLDDLVKAQNTFLEYGQIEILLGCSLEMTQVYCRHNTTPVAIPPSSRRRKFEEEMQVRLLLAVMTLLKRVVDWDILNKSMGERPDAGNVVLLGVHHILTVITPDFLDDAALANAFYSLLDGCFTMYSQRLTLVPEAVINQLATALMFALGRPQEHILRAGFRCVAALCNFCQAASQAGQPCAKLKETLPHFLRRILGSLVTERGAPNTIPAVSRAVLGLCNALGCDLPAQVLHEIPLQTKQRERLIPPFMACLQLVGGTTPDHPAAFHTAFETFALTCRKLRM